MLAGVEHLPNLVLSEFKRVVEGETDDFLFVGSSCFSLHAFSLVPLPLVFEVFEILGFVMVIAHLEVLNLLL